VQLVPLLFKKNASVCGAGKELTSNKEHYKKLPLRKGEALFFSTLMLARAVKDISFAGVAVAIMGGFLPSAYAAVSREEVVSYNLDYYSLKQDADAQKETAAQLEEKIMQEKMQKKKQREEASAKLNQERLNKAKGLFKRMSKDFKSSYIVEEKYDDNIFLSHESKMSVFTTTLTSAYTYNPEFIWKKGHTSFAANISGGPDENVTKRGTFIKAKGNLRTSLQYTRGKYDFGVNYSLQKSYSAASEFKTGAIISEGLVDSWTRSYGATMSMNWKYFPTDIGYHNRASLFRKDFRGSNLISNDVSITNYFDMFPKTRFLYSYEYLRDTSPERDDSDSVSNVYWVGVTGKLSEKINGVAKFGYQSHKGDSGGAIDTDTEKVELDYRMNQRLSHTIEASRSLAATFFEDEPWTETNDFKLTSNYLPPFNSHLRFGLILGFTNNGYTSGRKDDLYEGGLTVAYAMRYNMGISAKYDYKYNGSSEEAGTYRDQVVSLTVTKQF
jgi:hypothetical protein